MTIRTLSVSVRELEHMIGCFLLKYCTITSQMYVLTPWWQRFESCKVIINVLVCRIYLIHLDSVPEY